MLAWASVLSRDHERSSSSFFLSVLVMCRRGKSQKLDAVIQRAVFWSGNGRSAYAVPELAVSRLPSLVVDRLESRRNLAEQRLSPKKTETDGTGRKAGGRIDKLGVTGSSPVPPTLESPANRGFSLSKVVDDNSSTVALERVWKSSAQAEIPRQRKSRFEARVSASPRHRQSLANRLRGCLTSPKGSTTVHSRD